MILVWMLCVVLLGGCGPLVRIEEVRPSAPTTASSSVPTAPTAPTASAPVIPTGSVPNGTTEPSAPPVTPANPTPTTSTGPTTTPTPSATHSPGIVVESDEIVPVPESFVLDFNNALDTLLASVEQWEDPDAEVFEAP